MLFAASGPETYRKPMPVGFPSITENLEFQGNIYTYIYIYIYIYVVGSGMLSDQTDQTTGQLQQILASGNAKRKKDPSGPPRVLSAPAEWVPILMGT